MENYPPNSRKVQEEKKEPKKIDKIIEGKVVRRKKSFGKRFKETFIGGDDATSVWGYVLNDVLIPAAKDMISDAVSQGMERMIFGESRGGRSSLRDRGRSTYTSYNRVSPRGGPLDRREDPRRDRPREISRRARERHDFDEIVIDTKVEAEEVIAGLYDILNQYEVVTVADLYEMCGLERKFPDEQWGWTDLRGSSVTHVKGGYLLDLPQTEPID